MAKKDKNYKTYVLGDLHGAYKSLVQVMLKSNFDYNNDKLIFIGDLADGWDDLERCLDLLLKIKNLVVIIGNHDIFLMNYLKNQKITPKWLRCGGKNTIDILEKNPLILPKLQRFFENARYYN